MLYYLLVYLAVVGDGVEEYARTLYPRFLIDSNCVNNWLNVKED